MADAILTLNAGSSSIKFSLFEIGHPNLLKLASHGVTETVGSEQHFLAKDPAGKVLTEQRWTPKDKHFQPILEHMIAWTETHLGGDRLVAIGHRVVHGGPKH